MKAGVELNGWELNAKVYACRRIGNTAKPAVGGGVYAGEGIADGSHTCNTYPAVLAKPRRD